jgi:hypothetical protein
MNINYPQISVTGNEPKTRFSGVYSGTGVFTSTPSVRISGIAEKAQVIEVLENNSITFESVVQGTASASNSGITGGTFVTNIAA